MITAGAAIRIHKVNQKAVTVPEQMCLFTADGFEGEICPCDEGELAWIDKTEILKLPTWEGDAVFLKLLLEGEQRFFTLKLVYEGEKLVEKQLRFYN